MTPDKEDMEGARQLDLLTRNKQKSALDWFIVLAGLKEDNLYKKMCDERRKASVPGIFD